MKIPLLPLHIVGGQVLLEKEQMRVNLDALRSLTSDYIPDIEQLLIALREAKVGSAAYGRRKKRRNQLRKAHNLKVKIEAA